MSSDFNIPRIYFVNDDKSLLRLFGYCFNSREYNTNSGSADKFIEDLSKINLSFKIFFSVLKSILKYYSCVSAFVEPIYIDRIHRDSYYSYYSENHLEVSRYCKRILFFEGQVTDGLDDNAKKLQSVFLGSMVIRPLKTGCIGRTLLSPRVFWGSKNLTSYIRISKYKINFLGMELWVKAFPFLTQDSIVTTCAETSIMIMLDYYSNQYNDYRFALPSDISKCVQRFSNSRVLPSHGLSYGIMSKVLFEFGLFTHFHRFSQNARSKKYKNYLYYYVESGMPVCLNLSKGNIGHAVVCIGHKEISTSEMTNSLTCYSSDHNSTYFASTAAGCNSLIIMDDNLPPYYEYSFLSNEINPFELYVVRADKQNGCENNKMMIDCFIAPLHKRMHMIASRAEEVVLELIANDFTNPCLYFRNRKEDLKNWGTDKDNPLFFRLFLASSRHYRNNRIKNSSSVMTAAYRHYCLGVPLPQFIWVCELYTKISYDEKMAIGEIVIDATASPKLDLFDCILMINYTYDNAYFARGLDGTILDPEGLQGKGNEPEAVLLIKRYKGEGFKLKSYMSNLSNSFESKDLFDDCI